MRLTSILLLTFVCSSGVADDWPMWRGDAARTGASENVLPDGLSLLWHEDLGYPDAAFIHQFRMCADAAYAPVAAEGLLFVPSNLHDDVRALKLGSGETAWRYVTAGPVRFAPVAYAGKVYFGSDDGMVYCVKAESGQLVWKIRGVHDRLPDSRLLVNGRYCSRWPVRSGLVIHDGTLYFGAGLWPEEGVYVSAVDAETGELRWRTDALSLRKAGMNDHNRLHDLGLPPQGYLAVINGKLAVPSGRSLALFLDLKTGEVEPYNCYYSKNNQPRGTWWLTGNSRYWVQAGNVFSTAPIDTDAMPPEEMDLQAFAEYAGESPEKTLAMLKQMIKISLRPGKKRSFVGLDRVDISEKNGHTVIKAALRSQKASGTNTPRTPIPNELYNFQNRPFLNSDVFQVHDEAIYSEPVLSGDILYASIFDTKTKYRVGRGETYVQFPEFDRIIARDMSRPRWRIELNTQFLVRKLEFPVVWEMKTPHKVLISAGDSVIAGMPGEVIAIKPPTADGEQPQVVFRAKIDGAPVNALVSDGKLIVSTNLGKLYCFGQGTTTTVADQPVKRPDNFGKPYSPSFSEGYALVLGWGDGTQAARLLREGRHQIVVLETDETVAQQQRETLAAKGVYGRQIQIVAVKPDAMLSKYWANRVIVQRIDDLSAERFAAVVETVRPYTGRLIMPVDDRVAKLLKQASAASPEFVIDNNAERLELRRMSPPRGYADWTHETAGPGNTFANNDTLVKSPLGLLWFSGYIDRFYTPEFHFQHFRAPYPLICEGRMFLITGKYMNAVDAYTGNFLWKIEMPITQRVEWRYMDSRVYSRPYDRNYIATPDLLYIIQEEEIHLVDTATGETRGTFTIPEELLTKSGKTIWTEVRLEGGFLCCVVGDTLGCLDRHTGRLLWHRSSTRDGTTYALADGSLYGIDYISPRDVYRGEAGSRKESLLFRLDLATGTEQWSTVIEHATVPDQNPQQKRAWLLPITPAIIMNEKHQRAVVVVNRMTYYAFDTNTGEKAWEYQGDYAKGTGSLHLAPLPLVAEDIVFGSTADYKSTAVVLDVATGNVIDNGSWLDYKRGCSRVVGNCNLLTYRNSTTEVYDYENKTRLNFNSVRSGCTSNFLPAGGILNAPSFGHGCVCNYPTFASLALVHLPEANSFKPEIVKASETERSRPDFTAAGDISLPTRPTGKPIDVSRFSLIDAQLKPAPGGCRFSTAGNGLGYALTKTSEPLSAASFSFSFRGEGSKGRHGNSFFVLGSSDKPDELIQVAFYYGGRRRLIVSGNGIKEQSAELDLPRKSLNKAIVRFDVAAKIVSVEIAGKTLTAKLTSEPAGITHYGYSGSNSDTYFTEVIVEPVEDDDH